MEWIFEKNRTRLVVLSTDVSAENSETGEDLLAIVTVFVARHNGLRSAANCKRRRNTAQEVYEFQEGSEETSSRQGTTDLHLSQPAERLKLRRWIGTARWTYNRCLIAVEKEGIKSRWKRYLFCRFIE